MCLPKHLLLQDRQGVQADVPLACDLPFLAEFLRLEEGASGVLEVYARRLDRGFASLRPSVPKLFAEVGLPQPHSRQ